MWGGGGGGGGVRGAGQDTQIDGLKEPGKKRMELFSLFLSDTRDAGSRHCTGKMENTFFLSGRAQGICQICQKTGKIQEILFSQLVNSLVLTYRILQYLL